MVQFVGIAGGSGSGKSTLAVALCTEEPERYALVHLDDYFKRQEDAPRHGEFVNWDHPDCLRFDDLYADLCTLKEGGAIEVRTKGELYYPEFDPKDPKRIPVTISSKPVVLVEGYLALHDVRVRALMDARIYLAMPVEESSRRRTGNKGPQKDAYFTDILIPAHKEFVEPTKAFATCVIDVSDKRKEEVLALAKVHIHEALATK